MAGGYCIYVERAEGGFMRLQKSVVGQMSLFDEMDKTADISCVPVFVTTIKYDEKKEQNDITSQDDELQKKIISKIKCCGSKQKVLKTESLLRNIRYTGYEGKDRLLIQSMLDSNTGLANVLYKGNTVYPSAKLIRELKKMQKSNSIEKMSKDMYNFLMLNFDIAHYDKNGYISYYDGRYDRLYSECLSGCRKCVPNWHTDIMTILDAAGIE